MQEYFSWATLATYSGAILAVSLITQFIKDLGPISKIPTRVTAYVVAVLIMLAAMLFTDGFSWSGLGLTLINAVVVALAANGAHDALDERERIICLANENEEPEEEPEE